MTVPIVPGPSQRPVTLAALMPPPAPRRRGPGLWIALAAVAAVIIAAASVGLLAFLRGRSIRSPLVSPSTTFIVTGTLELSLLQTGTVGQPCSGFGGYRDVQDGAQVVVYGPSDETLGLGELDGGQLVEARYNMACHWSFRVADVPAGKGFYAIEVAHRGKVRFTEAQIRGRVELSLGG